MLRTDNGEIIRVLLGPVVSVLPVPEPHSLEEALLPKTSKSSKGSKKKKVKLINDAYQYQISYIIV